MRENFAIINGKRVKYDACADNSDAYADVAEKLYLGWGFIEGTNEYRHFWAWTD